MPSSEETQGARPSPTAAGPFTLRSSAFAEGGAIPVEYTCDGANTSPALAWSGAPSGTASFALIVDDPDAGGFIHWVVYDLDAALSGLPADVPRTIDGDAPFQGENSFGKIGYGGPCPPSGTHHYRFRLMALAVRLTLSSSPKANEVLAAATGHILGETILIGTYRRH